MIDIRPNETKDIVLSIKTVVIDPAEKDVSDEMLLSMLKRIVDGDNVSDREITELLGEDTKSEIELSTEAKISMNNKGGIEISYMENEDEVGRISKMKVARMGFKNGDDVLTESIAALKKSMERQKAKKTDTIDSLNELLKKKREG